MARTLGAMLAAAPWNNFARFAAGLVAALAIITVSACTTGDVFALQPAVDVGSQTAAVPQPDAPQYSGMQRLVPSNPYMT
ncbi:MAG: extensin, partial [Mesorhizobium sp.]